MKKSSSGYILILTLLVSGVIFLFTIFLLNLLKSERDIVQYGKHALIAEAAANAGIAEAVSQLQTSISWSGTLNNPATASGAYYTMTFNPGTQPYSTNNVGSAVAVSGYGGRQVPPKMVHLVSVGVYENSRLIEEALVGDTPFKQGLFVDDSITLNGAVTVDSTTSSTSGGDIGTNGSGASVVTLNGTVDVNGIITVGPGGSSASIDSHGGSTYNGFEVASKTQSLPIIEPAPGVNLGDRTFNGGSSVLPPGTYGKLRISGGAIVTFLNGTYIFTDDIDSNGGSIQVAPGAKVIIYAQKNIDFSGTNEINATMSDGSVPLPANFLIFGGANTTKVGFSGNFTAYMGLYAPFADIDIGGTGDIYGSIVGNTLTVNGVAPRGSGLGVHYDASLGIGVTIPIVKTRW